MDGRILGKTAGLSDTVGLQLQPGMLVGGASTAAAVMAFVLNRDETNLGMVTASFTQKNFLRMKPGNYVELHFVPIQGRSLKDG